VGKTLAFTELGNFEITGVMRSHPKNTHFRFDVLVSFSSLPESFLSPEKIWDEYYNQYVYLLLDSKKPPAELEHYINNLAQKQNTRQSVKVTFELQHLNEITTSDAYNGIGTKWERSGFIVFGCIALLILLPACFNYTNISIARALKRSKEIGLRKTMGGVKSQIFLQFITETVIICLISLVGALGLFILMRNEFQSMMVHASSLDLSITPIMATLFILFALVTGLIAGAFPALYFAGLNPIQALWAINSDWLTEDVFKQKYFSLPVQITVISRLRNQYDFDSSPCGETVESSHFQTGDPVQRTWGRS
jgi:putative ABC transport system permease protein